MTDETSTSESDKGSLTTDQPKEEKPPTSESENGSSASANLKEIEAYSQICHTASTSIHWLIFAVAICSGGIALCLATFHFGNLNFAIKRRSEIQKLCWDCEKCAAQKADTRTVTNTNSSTNSIKNSRGASNNTGVTHDSNNVINKNGLTNSGVSINNNTNTNSDSQADSGRDKSSETQETSEVVDRSVSSKPSTRVCDECARGDYNPSNKPESCARLDEKENSETIQSYGKLVNETRTVTLPILNLKLVLTDFVLVVIIVGLFFWFWLRHTLLFTRSVLCSIYNSGNSSGTINYTISAYFLLLWSGAARKRLSNVPRYIFIFFIITIEAVIVSDVFEQLIYPYTWFGKFAESSYLQPGYITFFPYLIGKIVIEAVCLVISIKLFHRTDSMIKDIRNLLILIEWSERSFYPVMYKLFERLGVDLSRTYNEVSYQEEDKAEDKEEDKEKDKIEVKKGDKKEEKKDEKFELKFRCKFKDPELKNIGDKRDPDLGVIFSATVDLPKKAQEFANRHNEDRQAPDWMLEDEEKVGRSTFEQRRMKRFFCELLVVKDFGGEISKNFYKKIIDKIKEGRPELEDNFEGVIRELSYKHKEIR